jgi:sugar/nucleoside kinase (ribokinase family)
MEHDLDLIVHGICTIDILFSGLPYLPPAGEEVYSRRLGYAVGGSFITAAALARLGVRVGVICPLGTDQFSDFIRSTMASEGVVSLAYEAGQDQANVSVCMSEASERAIVSYSDELATTNFMKHTLHVLNTTKASMLHISITRDTMSVIEKARQRSMYVSMDVAWDEAWLRDPGFLKVISEGDLFIPNEREACTITCANSVEEAIQVLKRYVPSVVVKCGERGALCWGMHDAYPSLIPGIPVDEVIDTTGAGDNFDAGVLYGLLQKLDLHQASKIGNIFGAESVKGLGGTGRTVSLADVGAFLEEHETHER